MSGHHIMGPSSLARRFACPGSLHVEAILPDPPSGDAAERGTRIHQYTQDLIACVIEHMAVVQSIEELRPADVIDEEWEAAVRCLEFCRETFGDADATIVSEMPLKYELMGEEVFYGTCDVLIIDGQHGTIIDWKTGGKPVPDADCNWQGAGYALAAMQQFCLTDVRVIFYNPGPLCRQCTECTWDNQELLAARLMAIRTACFSPDAPLCISEQCRYCKGAFWGTCPAIAGERAHREFTASMGLPAPAYAGMSDEELVKQYETIQNLETASSAIKAEIIRRAKQNGDCGGYTVGTQNSPTTIPDPVLMAEELDIPLNELLRLCKVSTAPVVEYLSRRIQDATPETTKKSAVALAKAQVEHYTSAPTVREVLKKGRN